MYDLVIRGATVVDGLGHDPACADVAVAAAAAAAQHERYLSRARLRADRRRGGERHGAGKELSSLHRFLAFRTISSRALRTSGELQWLSM